MRTQNARSSPLYGGFVAIDIIVDTEKKSLYAINFIREFSKQKLLTGIVNNFLNQAFI